MSEVTYIWIPNWDGPDGFQHYKGRDPIWIKNYTRLLSHDEYLALSSHRRGLLHGIWLAFASSARRLRGDTRSLSSRLQMKVSTADLTSLSDAGFIEVIASNVLAKRLQAASDVLALTRAGAGSRELEGELEEEPVPVPVPEANYADDPGSDPDLDIDLGLPEANGTGAGSGTFDYSNVLKDIPA